MRSRVARIQQMLMRKRCSSLRNVSRSFPKQPRKRYSERHTVTSEKPKSSPGCRDASQLGAFINTVNDFVKAKKLTPEQGKSLIDAALAIADEITP